jgi:carbamoyl-phosphate synthase small subunit
MINTPRDRVSARLALEDGTVFAGLAFGACRTPSSSTGEVVFNTAMTGYQEAITDPSYAGQILTITAPMVGNYGIAAEDIESARPQVAGFVVRELARLESNQRSVTNLSDWLAAAGVLGIEGIDTRALVRRLRQGGSMRGVISCDASKSEVELVEMASTSPMMSGCNLAAAVSPHEASEWTEGLGEWGGNVTAGAPTKKWRVLALDCGAKRNIYRNLVERGCAVHVVPHDLSAQQIRDLNPDGLFISNGPGDPEAVEETIETLREVAGEIPTFGICLGHQLLAIAQAPRPTS